MASALLRSSAGRGSAFRRVISAAAAVPPGEGLAVRRTVTFPRSPFRSLCSGVQGDKPSMSLEEQVDQMLQQVKEFDDQFERNLTKVLKEYKEALRTEEPSGFERLLDFCGMKKNKFRHNFAQCCELATLFGLSAMVGFVIADRI